MIAGQRVLGVIPARGGSKGVPRKNIRPLAGKPLLAWSCAAALACPQIDRLVISSDDAEIIQVAKQWGCEAPFVRPQDLASDHAVAIDVALHVLATLPEHYDFMVWLQPTSPFRTGDDITACLNLCVERQASSCVSVSPTAKTPFWTFFHKEDGRLQPILGPEALLLNRQDLPQTYALNGAIYVAKTHWLKAGRQFMDADSLAYIMPQERAIDIDTETDFLLATLLMDRLASTSKA